MSFGLFVIIIVAVLFLSGVVLAIRGYAYEDTELTINGTILATVFALLFLCLVFFIKSNGVEVC